jgi:hypothetical protein
MKMYKIWETIRLFLLDLLDGKPKDEFDKMTKEELYQSCKDASARIHKALSNENPN